MTGTRRQQTADLRARRTDARRRILDAARDLLDHRRWHDLPLDEVMATAGLSRTVLYRHFGDREELLLALIEDSGLSLDSSGRDWKHGVGDPVEAVRAGLGELTAAMVEHGRLFQAVADAATRDDAVRAAYDDLHRRLFEQTAARIEADVAAGRSAVVDPLGVAEALVRMNEAILLAAFGQRPFADPDRTTAVLADVWIATIYGRGQGGAED